MTTPHKPKCDEHSGHEAKMDDISTQVKGISRLIYLLITILVAVNGGIFSALWGLNTKMSTIDGKLTIYEKIMDQHNRDGKDVHKTSFEIIKNMEKKI